MLVITPGLLDQTPAIALSGITDEHHQGRMVVMAVRLLSKWSWMDSRHNGSHYSRVQKGCEAWPHNPSSVKPLVPGTIHQFNVWIITDPQNRPHLCFCHNYHGNEYLTLNLLIPTHLISSSECLMPINKCVYAGGCLNNETVNYSSVVSHAVNSLDLLQSGDSMIMSVDNVKDANAENDEGAASTINKKWYIN